MLNARDQKGMKQAARRYSINPSLLKDKNILIIKHHMDIQNRN